MKRLVLSCTLLLCSTSARAGTVQREMHGGREYRVYTPDMASHAPLVVVLHGCTQNADGIADASRMDGVADEKGFVVAYPEQTALMGFNQCFEWWDPANQKRDAGEPKDLADGVSAVIDGHGIDTERVYLAGISAGGAMTVVLGATYPDRFAAIGVVAGLEYGATTSLSGVYAASTYGGPDPQEQGARAHEAMGTFSRVVPALVIQGDADLVVAPVNGQQVAAQWVRTNGIVLGEGRAGGDGAIGAPTTTTGEAGYSFIRTVHPSAVRGGSVVEHILVNGLGHAWPGGKSGASFSDPKGPDASRTLWAFFERRTLSQPIPGAPSDAASDAPGAEPAPEQPAVNPVHTEAASASSSDGGCAASPESTTRAWLHALLLGAIYMLARRRLRSGRALT